MTYSRLEVNSALDTLVSGEGDIEGALDIVIKFGSSLPVTGFSVNISGMGKTNDSFSGFTQEQGNVTVEDGREDQVKEYTYGHEERIGHYKMRHANGNLIYFHHFWKSDLTTKVADDDNGDGEFVIYYDKKAFSPIFYGREKSQLVFELLFLNIYRICLRGLHQFSGIIKNPSKNLSVVLRW